MKKGSANRTQLLSKQPERQQAGGRAKQEDWGMREENSGQEELRESKPGQDVDPIVLCPRDALSAKRSTEEIFLSLRLHGEIVTESVS